ncbi:MFS transporter [Mangrovibacterium diazotrophicum]|uniref:Putative MFS family arabinose efflux permease n=1 Tax=Mangrovibacterium diazotrophicum TaxID=1261403 RepID=A0A419VVP9_9BACT|nr:MFS transporter [Mangrovibacterium diazotrophicum]RKD86126.1 putative MFS family arabinose efflux permease [Mangrovibacterium diazotrophicum]
MPHRKSIIENRNLQLIFGVTLVAVMGVASITPAFPEVIQYFHITARQVGWLIVSFTLPGIFLTPLTGILADRLGRKVILIPSLVLFGLAGFACFFVRDFYWLLLLRFVQGVGASSLASINITLIGDLFSGNDRVAAMGYNASVLSIGTASYPAIGGLLTVMGWQFVFLLPILSVPLAILVLLYLHNPEPAGQTTLSTYFSNVWQTVNRKIVWGLFGANILLFVILYGAYLTYFPLLLRSRLDSGSVIIGGAMSLMSAVTALTSFQMPRINRLLSPKKQLLFASMFYLVSMLILGRSFNWGSIITGIVVFGLGHGVLIPALQNMMVGLASIQERAAFMSLNSMVLRVGQTLGPLLIGVFYEFGGIRTAFAGGAAVAVLMFLLILILVNPSKEDAVTQKSKAG